MSDYPPQDFPWAFYFNGEALPRWSQCWMSCGLEKRASHEMELSGNPITAHTLWLLGCRIDHVGITESEDERRFRICVRHLIKIVLTHTADFESEADTWAQNYGGTGPEVVRGLTDGLLAMSMLAERDGLAMWTSGYESDRTSLREHMRRVQLPRDSSDWLQMPHLTREWQDTQVELEGLRKGLVALVHKGGQPENIRRFVHDLRVEK